MKNKIIDNLIGGGADDFNVSALSPEDQSKLYAEILEMKSGLNSALIDQEKHDDLLQMIFALVFLVSYVLLIIAMLVLLFNLSASHNNLSLPEWAVAFLSTIFGAMSTKVSTITDFIFGGSKSADIRDRNSQK